MAGTTDFTSADLVTEGVMGSIEPNREQRADIEFGWPLLMELIEMDIGQAMAVRERDVIAVEAVEPTPELIERAGSLCGARGWVLLKSGRSAPNRAIVDAEMIRLLAAAGGGCLATGAGRVYLDGKTRVLEAADRARIAVVGVKQGSGASGQQSG